MTPSFEDGFEDYEVWGLESITLLLVWKNASQKTGRTNLWPMVLGPPKSLRNFLVRSDMITKIYSDFSLQYYRLYTMICKERIKQKLGKNPDLQSPRPNNLFIGLYFPSAFSPRVLLTAKNILFSQPPRCLWCGFRCFFRPGFAGLPGWRLPPVHAQPTVPARE